jgi:hypothetical protein
MAEFGIVDLSVPTKVWIVWDTDQSGVYLLSIHSTEAGAREAERRSGWVEEKEVYA